MHLRGNMHLKKNVNRKRQLEPGTRNMNMNEKKAKFAQKDTMDLHINGKIGLIPCRKSHLVKYG